MADRRKGDEYIITPEEKELYNQNGYVHLKGVLSEEELSDLEKEFMAFITREVPVEGRDFCDMSADYSKPIEDFSIINILLPSRTTLFSTGDFRRRQEASSMSQRSWRRLRRHFKYQRHVSVLETHLRGYKPSLKNSIYERRAASISKQLLGPDMHCDYDQLLAKSPNKPDAIFHWHQDLAYWPITKDTRTASFWLAIDNSTVENGCLHFVPGTHLEPELRDHSTLHGDRDKSHTISAKLSEKDTPKPAELKRGDATVHHERVLHGSGGNYSNSSWRRAWVIAFRSQETVEEERRRGFTHSHNDPLEVLNAVGKQN